MLKLNNFQEVIAKIDEEVIAIDDFLKMNFERVELHNAMIVAGMSEREHEGQRFAVPELQPLNIFGESFEIPVTLKSSGILYCHVGNSGLRDYYENIVAQMVGGIVKPPEKSIIMP